MLSEALRTSDQRESVSAHLPPQPPTYVLRNPAHFLLAWKDSLLSRKKGEKGRVGQGGNNVDGCRIEEERKKGFG